MLAIRYVTESIGEERMTLFWKQGEEQSQLELCVLRPLVWPLKIPKSFAHHLFFLTGKHDTFHRHSLIMMHKGQRWK